MPKAPAIKNLRIQSTRTVVRHLRAIHRQIWIQRYGGQELLDREGFDVVPCDPRTCDDTICHGWRVKPKRDRLFIGLFPAGIVYCDTSREEAGDYKRIAFMSYAKLDLEIDDPKSDLLGLIREAAAKIQARRGESFVVSGCGQTVLLGGGAKS